MPKEHFANRSFWESSSIGYITAFMEGSKLCIVMEFADGGDLAKAVGQHRDEGRRFKEVEVLDIFWIR